MQSVQEKTAKLFTSGNSQAVRIPKEFRFEGIAEVYIYKDGDKLVLSPRPQNWRTFFENPARPTEDFMIDREDTPPQPRDIF